MTRRTKPYPCGYACGCTIDPAAPPALDTCSYGGGHQSTALLVMAAQGLTPTRTFLFCNVGDKAEHPGTLEYVRHIATPYAEHHGIDLQELQRRSRAGDPEDLWERLMKPESKSLPIPVRMSNGAPGNRSCTADFKIRVVGRWLKQHGAHGGRACAEHSVPARCVLHQRPTATGPCRLHPVAGCPACVAPQPALVSIGISLDEVERANTRVHEPHERLIYPLIGLGEGCPDPDMAMRRSDCDRLIASEPLPHEVAQRVKAAVAEGSVSQRFNARVIAQLERSGYTTLPIPPKSSCFFCPFHRHDAWADLNRETPELFDRSAELEATLIERRGRLGKDPVFLTRYGIPLREAIATGDDLLPGMNDGADAGCDSGACWT